MPKKSFPSVSIVVPFYNIENCVDYCLSSLLAQDYQGDYEIVSVDDGSTDKTSLILDKYASLNSKINVIHKENGGQSEARNLGVNCANGEYVAFVDGDDVVSPYYISSLVAGLRFGEDAMVAGVHKLINSCSINSLFWECPKRIEIIDKPLFLREICFQRILPSMWGRLAKRSFFLEHSVPVGRLYEDIFITGEYVKAISRVALVNVPIYGYVARDGSTVCSKNEKMKKCVQYIEAIDRFCGFLGEFYPPESDEEVFFRSIEYSRLWRRLDEVVDCPDDAKEQQVQIQSYVKEHFKQIKACREVSKGNKVRFSLLAKSSHLYRFAFNLYDKVFKGLS